MTWGSRPPAGGGGGPGTPGRGIQSSVIDAAGHLIQTYTDGTTADLGVVKGQNVVNRGAWAANTQYNPGDQFSFGNALYSTPSAFTSGATFSAAGLIVVFTSPDPYIVTGLDSSAVATDRLCYLLPGSTVLKEAQPWTVDLKDVTWYYKESTGTIKREGGTVTVAAGGLTAGQRIVLIDKTSLTATNWQAVTSPVPAGLQPTAIRPYLEAGVATGANQFAFRVRDLLSIVDASLTPIFDNLSSYNLNDTTTNTPTTANYRMPYLQPSQPVAVGSDAAYPGGVFMKFNAGGTSSGTNRRIITRVSTSSWVDGEVRGVLENDNGTIGYIRWVGRATGAVGSETNVAMQLNTSGVTFVVTVNGVANTIQATTGGNLTNTAIKLVQGTMYEGWLRLEGTKIRGKIWTYGTAEPAALTLEAYQNQVLGAGDWGFGIDLGYLKIGRPSFSRSTDPAPVA